ncbi:MAG: HTTM domain-containing protein [Bacteriovoracaceae bacterium]|nr:HTTM domain-containing protein [Bacteriovoracaceae bacterium]
MKTLKMMINKWDNFFFEEKPTEGIALFRIVWVGLLLMYYFADIGNIQDFYGPHALISLDTVREQFPMLHANIFHMFNISYEFTYFVVTVYGLSLALALIGLFTRPALTVVLLCMTSLHQRNIWLLSSSELLMRTITLLLIFSPCGHSLSIDSFLGNFFPRFKNKRTWSVWVVRIIQIQVSVIYLWTVFHKLKGATWLEGTAVYYATRLEDLTNFTVPYLMNSLIFLKIMTWGTLIIEFALGFFIWFKKWRKSVLILGIIFHLGIQYFMSIPFFELYLIALLINFFTPEELKAFADKGVNTFIQGIQESTLGTEIKEKIVRTLRENHETVK